MSDSAQSSSPSSKNRGLSLLLGGVLIGVAVLGVGYFLVDNFLDQQAEQRLEEQIAQRTGAMADCAEADVTLLQGKVTYENCSIANLPNFPSPYLVKITTMTFQGQSLGGNPVKISELSLEGLDINLDIQANLNPQNLLKPQSFVPINLVEALINIKQFQANASSDAGSENAGSESTGSESASSGSEQNSAAPARSYQIDRMVLRDLTVNVHLQAFLLKGDQEFPLEDIELTDVNPDNLSEKLMTELRRQINPHVQEWLAGQGRGVGQQMVDRLLQLLQDSFSETPLPEPLLPQTPLPET